MKKTIIFLMVFTITFVSCSDLEMDYSGKWINPDTYSIILIEKEKGNYFATIDNTKYIAEVTNNLLRIHLKPSSPLSATIDKNGSLIIGGNEFVDFNEFKKDKNNIKKAEQKTKGKRRLAVVEMTNSFNQVINQYQRKVDIILNLIRFVEKHLPNDTISIAMVRDVHNNANNTKLDINDLTQDDVDNFIAVHNSLTKSTNVLFELILAHTKLSKSEKFLMMDAMLDGTVNRIEVEERRYNRLADENKIEVEFPHKKVIKFPKFVHKQTEININRN